MGSSGMTIPKPMRSMKTVRKRTTSGERPEGARRDTARGNRIGSGQSSRSRAAASAAFGAEPAEAADVLARLAQERRAQARRRRLKVGVAQRAQIARELTKPRAAVPRARGGERLRLAHALLDHPQRQVERPPVTAPGRRTRTRPGGPAESLPTKDAAPADPTSTATASHSALVAARMIPLLSGTPYLGEEKTKVNAAADRWKRDPSAGEHGARRRCDMRVIPPANLLITGPPGIDKTTVL